jgi:hypothetical protein
VSETFVEVGFVDGDERAAGDLANEEADEDEDDAADGESTMGEFLRGCCCTR